MTLSSPIREAESHHRTLDEAGERDLTSQPLQGEMRRAKLAGVITRGCILVKGTSLTRLRPRNQGRLDCYGTMQQNLGCNPQGSLTDLITTRCMAWYE